VTGTASRAECTAGDEGVAAISARTRRSPVAAGALVATLVATVLLTGCAAGREQQATKGPSRVVSRGLTAESLPLSFIENRGQADRRASYYAHGKAASVFFTPGGLALSLADERRADRRWALRLDFLGAAPTRPRPVGQARTSAVVNYFKGPRRNWQSRIPTYSKVAYRNAWPGVDVVYSGSGASLKYSFLVKPGADPKGIRLAWRGASGIDVNRRGQLEVSTPARTLRDEAPTSYQIVRGRRVAVSSSYTLGGRSSYGFRVGGYDRRRPLVIDPAGLVYAGYLGGTGEEQANNVALDKKGNLYVVGTTTSSDFPATVGDTTFNDKSNVDDTFVAKVDRSGKRLLYATFIGGSKGDTGIEIAVDGAGAAYVGGSTSSSQTDGFPVTVGPDTTYNGGPQDAWVAKLKPGGTGLAYAGYIGGAAPPFPPDNPNNEQANGLVVDRSGRAYVAGFTQSDGTTFPDGDGFGAVPGFDRSFGGIIDAFVARVNADGSGLGYATYLGGGGGDAATGLSVDASNNAYVPVYTGSTQGAPGPSNPFGGFPVTAGAFDETFNGQPFPLPSDIAAVKLDPSGTRVIYATYIGGAGDEHPFGNVVDSSGNVYITGYTTSDQRTFPNGKGFGRIPGFDRVLNANGKGGENAPKDAFVVKLNARGSGLGYATYIGGAQSDDAVAIDLDADRNAYVFGTTASNQRTFPARGGPDSTYNGGPDDAFVAKLSAGGAGVGYAGYVGGSGEDEGIAGTVDRTGSAYVSGSTDSSQSSFPAKLGPDKTKNGAFGSTDAFVAKLPAEKCTIVGTAKSDTLRGSPGPDVICGLGGNDLLVGAGGNDLLSGGSGRDRCVGGKGRVKASSCESTAGVP